MQSSFIQKLQNFQYTSSSEAPTQLYLHPVTTSPIFMKTCHLSPSSEGLSFIQQKPSLRTEAFTNSRSTSSTHVVQNICNQIKYLIEGNLRSSNTEGCMMDFVRENIIPMLIKMFFQPSKTDDTIKESFDGPSQEFKDITNHFGVKFKSWKTQTFNANEGSDEFCETAKSDFVRNSQTEVAQNLENQNQNQENKENQIQNTQNEQKVKESQTSELLNQQQKLTKTLCLSILLLKTLVVKKSMVFQQLKQFGIEKQKKLVTFANLVRENQLKKCIHKFLQNKARCEKQVVQRKIAQQSIKFNIKQKKLSCQVFVKILKIKIRANFKLFKDNSFSENKWLRQWVRNAALRSPLTVKTSIWRLKQFLSADQPKQKTIPLHIISKNSGCVQRKVTEPDVSRIHSDSDESISSNQFEKMFQNEEEEANEGGQRISLEIMAKNTRGGERDNIRQAFAGQEKKKFEDDEYLRTISEDEQESSTVVE